MKLACLAFVAPLLSAENCAIPLTRFTPAIESKMPLLKPPATDDKMGVPPPMPACAFEDTTPMTAAVQPNILRNKNWKLVVPRPTLPLPSVKPEP